MSAKKIALFSDGTGNSSAKLQRTNVWRSFQALDQSQPDQLAKYDDGVGTSSNKYLALLGGAFGWGLKRNVIDLYKFVCSNYTNGDEIYGFGFSRGAFTIRVLVDLIASEGLVTFNSTEELDRNARAAYRRYRAENFPSYSPVVFLMRLARNLALAAKDIIKSCPRYETVRAQTLSAGRKSIPIRFLGLWDTVEAYGMPIESLKRGISLVLWPMLSGDQKLVPIVQRACHALSLDDERSTFHPLLWDEREEALMVQGGQVPRGRITQVWFAGVHSNVGGGYPEDQLSMVPLDWILSEAMSNGLRFDTEAVRDNINSMSPYARMYDSRSGWASYYRYAPRQIYVRRDPTAPEGDDKAGRYIRPIIHGSVIMRMAHGSDQYSPISLPHEFWVLAPDGELLPMEGAPLSLRVDATKQVLASVRTLRAGNDTVENAKARLQAAIAALSRPSRDLIRQVWDAVFWRQVVYSLTVLVSALLVLLPMIGDLLSGTLQTLIGRSPDTAFAVGLAESLQSPISYFLPSYLGPWILAVEQHPIETGVLGGLLVALLAGGNVLQQRIHDTASRAWRSGGALQAVPRSVMRFPWTRSLLLSLAVLAVGVAVARSVRSPVLADVLTGCAALAIVLLVFTLIGHHIIGHRRRSADDAIVDAPNPGTAASTLAGTIARRLRYSRPLRCLYRVTTRFVVPGVFVAALIWAGLCFLNSVSYSLYSAAGLLCHESPESAPIAGSTAVRVDIRYPCQNTGRRVILGQRYRVTLTGEEAWFDHETQTDVHGYPGGDPIHVVSFLLKRHWTQPWFRPYVRVGEQGAEEYAVAPDVEASAPPYPRCRVGPGRSEGSHFDPIDSRQADACDKTSPIPAERQSVSMVFSARSSGWLYFYVNDASWGWPSGLGTFYRNNVGEAALTLDSIPLP